jgi:hypothetical protein
MTSIDLRAVSVRVLREGTKKWWILEGGCFGESEMFVRFCDLNADWQVILERIAQRIIAEKRRPNVVGLTASHDVRILVFAVTKQEVSWFSKLRTPVKNVGAWKKYSGKWWPVTEY